MNSSKMSLISQKIIKIGTLTAGILASMGGLAIASNWTFIRRVLTYPEDPITNVKWYQTLETVAGNPDDLIQKTSSSIDQDTLNQITDYAEASNSSALLVIHQGQLVLERYWGEFTPSSTFNAMSMSKTITALLIGIAIAQGDIESELEPVANYIQEWSDDERRKITIQDLLYMQSGLRNQDNTNNPNSDLVKMFAGTDVDAISLKIPAVQEPRQAFDYNNANTQILSEVLERATDKRYADYLSNNLWKPLQANNANLWLDRPQGNAKAFCCLFATPRDWARIGQLFLDQGTVNNKQIVRSAWLDKMIQPSPLEAKYGYHIWLQARTQQKPGVYDKTASKPFLAQDTIYLDGASRQRVYIIPSLELVIVRVGEKPDQWDDSVIPNTLVNSLLGN
ncbi:MAG: serine hydrolase [Xenococcaceae cyanobacterium MO_188.B19]|nr:serine hydrolase [Xenococcaceae cyanobacterium MO_188.B19]